MVHSLNMMRCSWCGFWSLCLSHIFLTCARRWTHQLTEGTWEIVQCWGETLYLVCTNLFLRLTEDQQAGLDQKQYIYSSREAEVTFSKGYMKGKNTLREVRLNELSSEGGGQRREWWRCWRAGKRGLKKEPGMRWGGWSGRQLGKM